MLTLEQSTANVVTTHGLFAIPLEAFQFDWDKLNRIFMSTFHKYELFCPKLKTIQTGGGNPITMPEDCIYPRAIGFGNSLMIPPQTVAVERQSWSYDRDTRQLCVFTKTASSAPFQVQYLARHSQVEQEVDDESFEIFSEDKEVEVQFSLMPDPSTLQISLGTDTLEIKSQTRDEIELEGTLGTATFNKHSLMLTLTLDGSKSGMLKVTYKSKYKGFDTVTEDDDDFFETWYAANILTSLGNIKAVLKLDEMPNSISADDLISQGRELMNRVVEWQHEKHAWFRGYISARI